MGDIPDGIYVIISGMAKIAYDPFENSPEVQKI
jgi:hypothetical protein